MLNRNAGEICNLSVCYISEKIASYVNGGFCNMQILISNKHWRNFTTLCRSNIGSHLAKSINLNDFF